MYSTHIICYGSRPCLRAQNQLNRVLIRFSITPNPPTNIVPTNIARVKLSGKSPMNLGIPPLETKVRLESDPLKPTMLVGRVGELSCRPMIGFPSLCNNTNNNNNDIIT